MHVPTSGRILREVIEQVGDLFDFLKNFVVHRALRVHHFGRVALVRGKNFVWGVSVLAPGFVVFPQLLHDCVERYLCL